VFAAMRAVAVSDAQAASDSARDRRWGDLPWAAHHVTLVYSQRRVVCR